MNTYRDTFISGWNAKFLNILLLLAGISLLAWTVSIWLEPAATPYQSTVRRGKAPSETGLSRLDNRASFKVVENNDIFRASRTRYVAPPKPVVLQKTVQRALPVNMPRLTLLGTVILDESKAAIISIQGMENDAKFYKVGERIGGFTIKKINKDSVLLKSGSQVLTVPLSRPNETKGLNTRGGSVRPYGR